MKELLLISPANRRLFSRDKARRFPAIGLPVVANLTPPDWNVTLVDEYWGEQVDLQRHYDLVGIGTMTAQAMRAYELADHFRNQKIPVVLGGSHPSVCSDEALEHADAVVIGEAEQSWPQLLRDLAEGKLQQRYQSLWPEHNWYVSPRRDLVKTNVAIGIRPVVASRGCPHQCGFCSVHHVFGRKYRLRPVDEVIAEIDQLVQQGAKAIGFLDDNIMGHRSWAKELFRRLIPYKLRWGGQATLDAAQDRELMSLAAASGCISMFVGLESVNYRALKGVQKGFNKIERYKEWCQVYHDNGIVILAGVIFGFDEDDKSVFELTVEVLDRLGIAFPNFTLLIPLPGTQIYDQMKAQGRLLTNDWSHYTGSEVIFVPKQMTPEELQEGSDWADFQFYKPSKIVRRFFTDNWQHPIYYAALGASYWYKCFEHTRGKADRMHPADLNEAMGAYGLSGNHRSIRRMVSNLTGVFRT